LIAGVFAVGSYQPNGYYSGMHIATYNLGAGKFYINTLLILENLGKNPSADRLLINFICHSAKNIKGPLMALPSDFENQLADIGYAL